MTDRRRNLVILGLVGLLLALSLADDHPGRARSRRRRSWASTCAAASS